MIITVTAPKKGLGQTTTTINLAAMLLKFLNEFKKAPQILIIDINKYCKDIEYYLSNSVATRGLDDFFSLYQSNLITDESFKTCLKKINDNINIIGSNEYFELTDDAMESLLKMSKDMFDFVIVDSIGTSNITGIQKTLFDRSDKIVVTLNQTKSATQIIRDRNIYKDYMKKITFLVNRYIDSNSMGTMEYTIKEIKAELEEVDITSDIFPLDFDVEIMNESNFGSILSFVLGDKSEKKSYNRQMREIIGDILKDNPKYQDIVSGEVKVKKSLFNFKK